MSDLDDKLERMQADGRVTTTDADEVRNFADFLTATGGLPKDKATWTAEHRKVFGEAYREHYPEDYERAVAEERARRAREEQG